MQVLQPQQTALSVLAGGTVGAAETKAYTKVIKDYYTVVNGKEETRKVAVVTNPKWRENNCFISPRKRWRTKRLYS